MIQYIKFRRKTNPMITDILTGNLSYGEKNEKSWRGYKQSSNLVKPLSLL